MRHKVSFQICLLLTPRINSILHDLTIQNLPLKRFWDNVLTAAAATPTKDLLNMHILRLTQNSSEAQARHSNLFPVFQTNMHVTEEAEECGGVGAQHSIHTKVPGFKSLPHLCSSFLLMQPGSRRTMLGTHVTHPDGVPGS